MSEYKAYLEKVREDTEKTGEYKSKLYDRLLGWIEDNYEFAKEVATEGGGHTGTSTEALAETIWELYRNNLQSLEDLMNQ
jgi:hypothetical protein